MNIVTYLDDYNLLRVYNATPEFLDNLIVVNGNEEIGFKAQYLSDCVELYISKEIDLEKKTYLFKEGSSYHVEYRLVLQTKRFETEYMPDIKMLGSSYFENFTFFRVWAPLKDDVTLILNNVSYPMKKMDKGVWQLLVNGNFDGARYHYVLKKDNVSTSIIDPFSYAKTNDGIDSFVVNVDRISKDKVTPKPYKTPIIYEVSVRDFSSSFEGFKNPKHISAFKEEQLRLEDKTVGLDYLKELGITHIQLLPILDFDDDYHDYNWGYNPVGYNTIKSSYLNFIDPYGQIAEVQETFKQLHKNNIRIVLDVVYNHVYSRNNFIFNKILPNYFYRFIGTKIADGAGLGNELRTEARFMSEYLVYMNKRLVDIYDIDGLRFDLSGLVDKDTCLKIRQEIIKDKPDFITIGEGWDMGEALTPENKCRFENAKDIEGYCFFNPRFRDTIAGRENKGLALGNESLREDVKKSVAGLDYYLNDKQSINYTECHDDHTLYDLIKKLNNDFDHIAKQRIKLALALTIISRGIPFIHAGEEFMRTKKGIRNSYNAPDDINTIDWNLRVKNDDLVEYTKELIKLRNDLFDYYASSNIGFEDYFEVIIVNIDDLKIMINPCPFDHIYAKDAFYETIFDGERRSEIIDSAINVKAYSVAVAKVITKM